MPREEKSLQAEFDGMIVAMWPDTRTRPYPDGNAYKALRKAFFGGCMVAYSNDFRMDLLAYRAELVQEVATHTAAETQVPN